MKGIGYTPYRRQPTPLGTHGIVLIVLFVVLLVVIGLGALASIAGGGSTNTITTASHDGRAYDMGVHGGQTLALTAVKVGAGVDGACLTAYQADLVDQEMTDKVFEVSWPDYLAGCNDALEASGVLG